MDIILLQDIDKLGDKYEIVNVKDGYGRNYLIPQGIGVIANARNLAKLDDIKRKGNGRDRKNARSLPRNR